MQCHVCVMSFAKVCLSLQQMDITGQWDIQNHVVNIIAPLT